MFTLTPRRTLGLLSLVLSAACLLPSTGCCSRCTGTQCDIALTTAEPTRPSTTPQTRSVLKLSKGSAALTAARR